MAGSRPGLPVDRSAALGIVTESAYFLGTQRGSAVVDAMVYLHDCEPLAGRRHPASGCVHASGAVPPLLPGAATWSEAKRAALATAAINPGAGLPPLFRSPAYGEPGDTTMPSAVVCTGDPPLSAAGAASFVMGARRLARSELSSARLTAFDHTPVNEACASCSTDRLVNRSLLLPAGDCGEWLHTHRSIAEARCELTWNVLCK
jgi:hypothetical protein